MIARAHIVIQACCVRKTAMTPSACFHQDVVGGGIALDATKTIGGGMLDSVIA